VAAAFARAWSDHKKEATINRQPATMVLIATSSNSSGVSNTMAHGKCADSQAVAASQATSATAKNKRTATMRAANNKQTINQQQ